MPVDQFGYGQMLTFAVVQPAARGRTETIAVKGKKQTVAKLMAQRGRPDLVQTVLAMNKRYVVRVTATGHGAKKRKVKHYLRSAHEKLRPHTSIKVPAGMGDPHGIEDRFNVLCGDNRPVVKDGYAKYDTVDRPGRLGLDRFLGYNPIEIDCEVQFEAYGHAHRSHIEEEIAKLEKFAGRGDYHGAADGAPAVVEVSVSDYNGNNVPLLGPNYQWSKSNRTAPLYRIAKIDWKGGDLSDSRGKRIRSLAVITIRQYTPLTFKRTSAAKRAQARRAGKVKE